MSTRKVIEEAVTISTVLSTQNKPEAENVCCILLEKKSERQSTCNVFLQNRQRLLVY